MNCITIIGNLVREPELRSTPSGVSVCSFSVAVNRRKREGQDQPEADFFNVSVWRELGENCAKYLSKGKKVCVMGAVSCRAYTRNDGSIGASMDVNADKVEFLSSRNENQEAQAAPATAPAASTGNSTEIPRTAQQAADMQAGFTAVETDELPFEQRVSLPG